MQPTSEDQQLIQNDNNGNSELQAPLAMYNLLTSAYILYTLIVGYTVSVQPSGAGWRYFSLHPFLMVSGFIGMMGISAITKKLGGYKNTKIHGMMASAGLFMAFGGLYVIYRHKEMLGKEHITSTHSTFGIVTMAGCFMAMLAGGIFLHPDFGVDKTNKTIRFAHKWFARSIMLSAWVTCLLGLMHLTSDTLTLALFTVPLILFAPFTLV